MPALERGSASDGADARYARLAGEHAAVEARHRTQSERIGRARILLFVVIIAAIVALVRSTTGATTVASSVVLAASFVAFMVLVYRHGRVRDALLLQEQTRTYFEIGVLRVRRDWDALPPG